MDEKKIAPMYYAIQRRYLRFYFIWELFRSLDHKLQEIAENGCFVTR